MVRESARQNVKTTAAFGGFRDAVCMSAVIFGQGMTLSSKTSPMGIVHSDAFDVYPWFPTPQMDGREYASVGGNGTGRSVAAPTESRFRQLSPLGKPDR